MSMLERLAIRELADAYSAAVTQKDEQGIAACFAPDGTWEVRGAAQQRFSGAQAIGRGIMEALAAFDYNVQVNTAFVIDVRGDEATSRCSIVEHGRLKIGAAAIISGVYRDRLVRLGDAWRFQDRVCDLAYFRQDPFQGVFTALPPS